jgi:hypothetical protein
MVKIGILNAVAFGLREPDEISNTCAHCGEPVTGSYYADVFEERLPSGPGSKDAGSIVVAAKICHKCGSTIQDWIPRGGPLKERDPDERVSRGWSICDARRAYVGCKE